MPACGEAIGLIEIFGVTGDGENRNRSRARRLLQRATELEPVHPGNGEIGQHRVGTQIARLLERLMAVVGIDGAEAVVLQVFAVQHSRAEIVFDDQHQRISRGGAAWLGLHPSIR